jgi:hypothetical protein
MVSAHVELTSNHISSNRLTLVSEANTGADRVGLHMTDHRQEHSCILHYGKGCIMIRKGKRHMTVNSPALPRVQPPVEEEKCKESKKSKHQSQ